MTPNEFKAWFDGFTEAFEGRIPTKAQWGRIRDRVAEIDGKPVTERVYVDRYWSSYVKTYPTYTSPWTTTTCGGIGIATSGTATLSNVTSSNVTSAVPVSFNSAQAMADLGRADAKALAA